MGVSSRRNRRILSATAAFSIAVVSVQAQVYERVAPEVPMENPAPTITPPPVGAPKGARLDPNKVVMKELKGIHLVNGLSGFQPKGVAGEGVASDVPFVETPAPLLDQYLGKPLTLGGLASIEAAVITFYRQHNHPLVDVAVPPQDITNGVIQVVVSEYTVGQIRVLNNEWFTTGQTRDDIRLQPGDTVDMTRLQADLDWLNDNPFRRVDLVAKPGASPSTTDLDFVEHDKFPLSVYSEYSNDGSPSTGDNQIKIGGEWGNAFDTGSLVAYQHTTTPDVIGDRIKRPSGNDGVSFQADSLDFTIPLPWRDKLEIFGDYEQDLPDLGPALSGSGVSGQASIRYIMPMVAPAFLPGMTDELRIGYDFKTTNNNLQFGGTAISATTAEVDQFPIILLGTVKDSYGQTSGTNSLVFSPGGLTGANHAADFAGITPDASSNYVYDRLDIERDTTLPANYTWIVRLTGQVSSANLLPSEQLNVGGIDTVRGYEEFVANGSEGVLASTEIRTPAVAAISRFLNDPALNDSVQGDVFIDYAKVSNVQDVPGAPTHETLASAGVGLRYEFTEHFSARVEVGVPFETSAGVLHHSEFTNFVLNVRF
jgi:hemolysin activation/secretion protein